MRPKVEDGDFALPIGCITCPFCGEAVDIAGNGLTMIEELWMHEYECSHIVLADNLAA
jgi:hypothetical protein